MSQSRLRIIVFCLWLSFWVVSTVLLMTAPWIRNTPVPIIPRGEIRSAILSITGIWVPALSCLASFWFPSEERRKARKVNVTRDKVFAALTLTSLYLVFVLALLIYAIFLIDYNASSAVLAEGTSFLEQIDGSVKLGLVVSPIALAPINWLTGG
jgi:hypothetical protein